MFLQQDEKNTRQVSESSQEEAIMKCHRCNGSMIYEKFYSEDGDFFGWRCIVCGEIIDQVILKNRYQQN